MPGSGNLMFIIALVYQFLSQCYRAIPRADDTCNILLIASPSSLVVGEPQGFASL